MITVTAKAGEGFATTVEADGGHKVTVDEPAEVGGADTGPSPTRLLAASLASCVSITVRMYAERKGWDVSGLEVRTELELTKRGEPTPIRTELTLPDHLDAEQRDRILTIAGKCPVHLLLEGEVDAPVTLADPA